MALPRDLRETPPRFSVSENGAFDIIADGLQLTGCFPSIDDKAIAPISVKTVSGDSSSQISFHLLEGTLELTISRDLDSVVVQTKLVGFSRAPHWVYPLANAEVRNAVSFFKQGLGFGGPSGLFPIEVAGDYHDQNNLIERAWSYDTYLTAALVAKNDRSLAVAAYDHRNFLQRSTYYNRLHRSSLVDKAADTETVLLEVGFATEGLDLPTGELELPALHLLQAGKPYEALHRLAQNIAAFSGARTNKPSGFHWDSWYEYYADYDFHKLEEFLNGLKLITPPVPFQAVLIDAGWSSLGDWLIADESAYPGGLKAAFERIQQAGYVPGGYVGPFMVSSQSQLFKQHPDWILRKADGLPLLQGKGRPFCDNRTMYEERYFLDTSHPAAFDYLRTLFRTFRSWGVKFFKTDFMDWGLKDSTKVQRHTPGKTSVQYYQDVCQMIRQEIGEESFWLGCIAPFAPMIGLVDAMRVSYDIPHTWSENILNMFQETVATQYFNNVFWQNDPDVMMLRSDTATNQLSDEEIQTVTFWIGMNGGVVASSDRVHKLLPERLKMLRFLTPGDEKYTADLPFIFGKSPVLVAVRRYSDSASRAVLLINYSDGEVNYDLPINELCGLNSADVYVWSPGTMTKSGVLLLNLRGSLAAHGSRLYFLNPSGAAAPDERMALSGKIVF